MKRAAERLQLLVLLCSHRLFPEPYRITGVARDVLGNGVVIVCSGRHVGRVGVIQQRHFPELRGSDEWMKVSDQICASRLRFMMSLEGRGIRNRYSLAATTSKYRAFARHSMF